MAINKTNPNPKSHINIDIKLLAILKWIPDFVLFLSTKPTK